MGRLTRPRFIARRTDDRGPFDGNNIGPRDCGADYTRTSSVVVQPGRGKKLEIDSPHFVGQTEPPLNAMYARNDNETRVTIKIGRTI